MASMKVFRLSLVLLLVAGFLWIPSVEADAKKYEYHLRLPEYDSKSGNVTFFPRIVGGTPAFLGEFYGIVSLQTRTGQHICGGSILPSMRHILTAAHCLYDQNNNLLSPNNFRIMVDDLSIQTIGAATRQVRNTDRFTPHPNYNFNTLANDIAVIRVVSNFTVSATFRPFVLSQAFPQYGINCAVAGWGATVENGPASPNLQRVNAQTIQTTICNGPNSYAGLVPQGHFCAGDMAGGRDSCQGDSGGPLICNNQLTGVVSFGYGCARPNFPGVYTNVGQHYQWINQTTSHAARIIGLTSLITVVSLVAISTFV